MLKCSRVPMASCKLDKNLDVNLGSRSETIDIGTPCNLTISSTYNWANLSNGSSFLNGRKCADFISLSTITHMASCCLQVLRSPKEKSIVTYPTSIQESEGAVSFLWASRARPSPTGKLGIWIRNLQFPSSCPSTNNAPSEYDTSWCYQGAWLMLKSEPLP